MKGMRRSKEQVFRGKGGHEGLEPGEVSMIMIKIPTQSKMRGAKTRKKTYAAALFKKKN